MIDVGLGYANEAEMYELGVKARRLHDDEPKDYTCSYSVGFDDGTVHNPEYYSCHGWWYTIRHLPYLRNAEGTRIVCRPLVMCNVVQTAHRNLLKKEIRNFFYHYLLNESPFAEAFLSKDVNKLDDDGIIVRLDRHANYVCAAGIGTRHPWEKPNVVNTFYHLCNAGLQKDRAFLSAFCVKWDGKSKRPTSFISEGHTCIWPNYLGLSGVRNFLNHKLGMLCGTYYDELRYNGHPKMWNAPRESMLHGEFSNKFSKVAGSENLQSKDPFEVIPRIVKKEDKVAPIKKINDIFEEIVNA